MEKMSNIDQENAENPLPELLKCRLDLQTHRGTLSNFYYALVLLTMNMETKNTSCVSSDPAN